MKAFHVILFTSICMLFLACGSQQQTTTPTDSTATQVVVEEPSEKWLVLKYDEVRLRSTPSKGGEVLGAFNEGDQVLDLGERSENKETINFRGEAITAPWAKVRSKEGVEGWIFAGALGPAPDPSVAAFSKSLEDIKATGCQRLQAALDEYASAMKGKSKETADMAVVPLFAYLDKVATDENQQLERRKDTKALQGLFWKSDKSPDDPKALAERTAWEQCGLELTAPEGMLWLVLKPGLCLPALSQLVSDAMRQYLQIRKNEDLNPWSGDASLMITPKQLADRCVTWDAFLQDHPDFVFKQEIRQQNHFYLGSLLMGQDNSPVFEYPNGKMQDMEFKAAWEWVLSSHPKTHTAKIIQEWCDLVKPGGWKMNPKAQKYIENYWDKGE